MQRGKSRESIDELAVVKAAAWAWYQHGSGSEGKPIREFDITRSWSAPRPSRYKIEAMRKIAEEMEKSQSSSKLSPTLSDNSLLDTYEIKRISSQLEYLIQSRNTRYYKESPTKVSVLESDRPNGKMNKNKKKVKKGFWLSHAVICGSREDVVARAYTDSRLPKKHAPVRPQATHA